MDESFGPRGQGVLKKRYRALQIFAYMIQKLSADVRGMSHEEEISTRRGALKLLLMNQTSMLEANKVVLPNVHGISAPLKFKQKARCLVAVT